VNIRLFGCRKFSYLANEELDRELTAAEQRFIERHQAVCAECEEFRVQGGMALNMLRLASFESEEPEAFDVRDQFDERVIRRARLQNVRAGLKFWTPALIGAAAALVAVLAALQMVASADSLPNVSVPGGAARREAPLPEFPNIDLPQRYGPVDQSQ
jgi:hypothetical protein